METTTLMLLMIQRMDEQLHVDEDRYRADLQRSEDRTNRIFQGPYLGRAPVAIYSSIDLFPTVKIDFKYFAGESEDWNTWSRVHYVQFSALGCVDASRAERDEVIEIGGGGFDEDAYDPAKLRAAHQT